MRKTLTLLVAAALLAGGLAPVAALATDLTTASLIQEAPKPPDVKIDVDTDEGAAWYTNPLWIAIGALAILLVIVLVVAASRGGGTTVIRE